MVIKKMSKNSVSTHRGVPTSGKKGSGKGHFEMEADFDCNDLAKASCRSGTCSGGFYILGLIGSAAYYISSATSFGMGFIGVLKSLVWPAFVVFELLKFLGA